MRMNSIEVRQTLLHHYFSEAGEGARSRRGSLRQSFAMLGRGDWWCAIMGRVRTWTLDELGVELEACVVKAAQSRQCGVHDFHRDLLVIRQSSVITSLAVPVSNSRRALPNANANVLSGALMRVTPMLDRGCTMAYMTTEDVK